MNERKKTVLLLAPPYMGIYQDIISCLEDKGYDVLWIKDGQIKGNPYNKKDYGHSTKSIEAYNEEVNLFWTNTFNEIYERYSIDVFLAIDGFMVSHYFFNLLRHYYPHIKLYLYLYDRVENNYELDVFFQYYDKVFTFDYSDSHKYNIAHLPIYWVPINDDIPVLYDIFSLGSYGAGNRYEIFSYVRNLAIKAGLKENVRLYRSKVGNKLVYFLKSLIVRIKGKKMPSLSQFNDDIFTDKPLSPEDFRKAIFQSRVILDTHLPYQDGLTARFMWALGAEKKIITTNASVKEYPFYTDDQIYILDKNDEAIIDFIKTPFVMKKEVRDYVQQFRVDNWIKTIIDSENDNQEVC